jgi:hypothetical protein
MTPRTPVHVVPILAAFLLLAATGCGGSATTSVVGPSTSKCEIAVTNSLTSVPAAGATGDLTVATNRECSWSARADAAWITLGTTEGQGPAALSYTVAANATATPRQGAVVVQEHRVVVTQEAATCRYDVSPLTRDVAGAGEQTSVTLTTLDGCAWTVQNDANWIVVKPSAGRGSASVQFEVGPNPGPVRSGTVTIAGQVVRINQASRTQPSPVPPPPGPSPTPPAPSPPPGPPTPNCAYSVSPTRKTVAASGEALTLTVTAASGCAWTASSTTAWITIATGENGSGNGFVRVAVSPNSGGARSANLNVAGQTVTLDQPEAPAPPPPTCSYSIAPTSRSAGRDETVITLAVTAPSNCSWTAASQAGWITVTDGGSGSGTGSVRLIVATNNGPPRSGTVAIAGQTFTVQQDGLACTYGITPGSYSAASGADEVRVSVTAGDGCAWSASSNVSWVSIAEGRAGSGNGTVRLLVEANGGAPRTGTAVIAGETFTVQQAGLTCSYAITPTRYNAGRGPDDVRVSVSAQDGCAWTATGDAAWAAIVEGRSGSGNGVVRLMVQANSAAARIANFVIAGQRFTLEQEAGVCQPAIKPMDYHAGRGPDDIRITVTADAGCTWTATSPVPWVTVVEGRDGSGTGTVRLLVQANADDARNTILTIAGQPFTLVQDGAK